MKRTKFVITTAVCLLVLSAVGAFSAYGQFHRENTRDKSDSTNYQPIPMSMTEPHSIGTFDNYKVKTNAKKRTASSKSAVPSSSSSSQTYSQYKASHPEDKCYKTVIPSKTVYVDDPYRYIGEEWSPGPGVNGYILRCSYGDFTVSAVDKIIKQGTKPHTNTSSPAPTPVSYDAALSSCLALGTAGTSAFEQCMNAYGY